MNYKELSESAALHEKHGSLKIAAQLWTKASNCRTNPTNRNWALIRSQWCSSKLANNSIKAKK
ncbi:ANR family transcriptional regulator [Photobacterium damselae subsp. damselae]|uniref:ANR family transcriptional regulator n=1 Tax=Photobacterium damselae TaxID=38293 RepID=UPI001F19B8D0|nr:ANR family transcriptional regulator [Photobacterium damselae]UJZ95023.1 ANR family transcriptional regulator [Photobacterium damselae subsp. damselae]UJZ99004.1 ANR family transcriptional regulator [Photobacterium damselae subsp. damselae]